MHLQGKRCMIMTDIGRRGWNIIFKLIPHQGMWLTSNLGNYANNTTAVQTLIFQTLRSFSMCLPNLEEC
jgi:hypothetical protein